MLTAHIEPFMSQVDELKRLLGLHWEELALNRDKVPLAPQWPLYAQREAHGQLIYVTLRDGGELIGYIIMFVAPGLHYETCLTASMDILFVRPDRRDASAKGVFLMIDTLEAELRRRGVHRWFMATKLHKDISPIFKRRGFEPVEMMHSKWLGD
jgi:GNAT superfamily N-acetyltransferase